MIRGLTFTQYAYRAIDIEGVRPAATADEEPTDDPIGPADPSTFGKEVTGTTFEHVTISYCSRVAGYFRGDGLTIRHSLVTDTGTEGIYVIGSSDVLLERNIIRRNNVEQLTGYYPAAVKIFNQSRRVTVRDNLIVEQPHSNGVWYDVGTVDAVFVNNWVEGALNGFFFEISRGAMVAGNVFVEQRERHPHPQQRQRPHLPQHARQLAAGGRAHRAQRGRRSFRLASAHRPRRRSTGRARHRRQPARRDAGVCGAAAALRAAAGAVRPADASASGHARREPVRPPGAGLTAADPLVSGGR